MLTCAKLAKKTKQFKSVTGMTKVEFDFLMEKVEAKYPNAMEDRLSKKESRKRAIGAGRKNALGLRDRVILLPFHCRVYVSQDLAALLFGIGQASVSRSMTEMEPTVRECIPIPARVRADAEKITDIEELAKAVPGLRCLVDVGEQQIQRPKRNDMQKSHYSGKKKRHTAKVQYAVSSNGPILQNTKHSPGSVHDVKVYKMKPPIFKLRVKNEEGKYGDVTLNVYDDKAYVGAAEVPRAVNIPPVKKDRGKELTELEKKYNKTHSKIRIYVEHAVRRVKTWRIMGNVYRNPLRKYDIINDIVCGLVNQRLLYLATHSA